MLVDGLSCHVQTSLFPTKTDGQIFKYQIIGILLVHKIKQQIHQKYLEKITAYLHKNKNSFDESIALNEKKWLEIETKINMIFFNLEIFDPQGIVIENWEF